MELIEKEIEAFSPEKGMDNYVVFDDLKSDNIEGVNFSHEELAKKLGDLFYEPLASILDGISELINDKKISNLLKEASNNILEAWKHCKPYVTNIDELEKNSKHTFNIEGTNLSNEQLINGMTNLTNISLKELLYLLSEKLKIDGEADKGRNRLNLANALFESSKSIEEASEML